MSEETKRRFSGWNVALVVYAVASIGAMAGMLVRPGTVGHHWDWLIPSDPIELRHFAWTSGFAWQDFAFGSYVTYRYATTLTSFLFGAPGFFGLGGAFVTKVLLVGSVFVSGVGMRFLLLTLVRDDPDERDGIYATLAGLLYALAPFAYNQMIAGDQSALISNALSPIAIALAVRAVFAEGRIWLAYALGSALFLTVVVASAQVFVFTIGVMWAVGLVLRWSARCALRLGGLTVATIALCSFWILPAFLGGGAVNTVVQTASPERALATLEQFSNPWYTLTTIAFPGDFYLRALGLWGAVAFFTASAALAAMWIAALINRRTPLLIVLSAIFLLTAFLPLGGNAILGPIVLSVFKAFLPYSLVLRTPQHMMFVVTLVLPILAFLSARVVPARYFGASLAAGVLIVLVHGQGFFTHGDFFGLIGPFRETAGEHATAQVAAAPQNRQYRTLFIPNEGSYYFHPAIFDYYFEGADEAQIRFLPGMTMAAGSKWTPYDRAQALLKALDELVPDGADPATQHLLLQLAGVKDIIVHQVGVPGAGVRLAADHARPYLDAALHGSGIATLQKTYEDRTLWRFDTPVTRTYAPDCIFGVPPEAGPYEVLALSNAAAACKRPGMIPAGFAQRSEEIVPSATFRANSERGMTLRTPQSNVPVAVTASREGFTATIPGSVQDVETLTLPPMPRTATGIALRMFSSDPRRVWVQLYAPDARNYFETNVDFSGKVQDVALNFRVFGRVGNPNPNAIRLLRFASRNVQLRDEQMYVGSIRWIAQPSRSANAGYLAIATNRWDQYYFGSDRAHVLFEAIGGLAPVYTSVRIAHAGSYDIFAHVQEYKHALSLQVSTGSGWSACSSNRLAADVSERIVRLARVSLSAGAHTIGLRYCSIPLRPVTQDVGVQSLILASAVFTPPARRATGTVSVVDQRAGSIELNAGANLLVFSDAFDDRWSGTQNGGLLTHVLVNGYANGWIVPNPGAGDVVLSFTPQRLFTFGMNVTFALVLLALIAIGVILSASARRVAATRLVASEDANH